MAVASTTRSLSCFLSGFVVVACSGVPSPQPEGKPEAAYVVLGVDGMATARALVADGACPELVVDGVKTAMSERVGPAFIKGRQSASAPTAARATAFPVTVCEAPLASGHGDVHTGAFVLPRVSAQPRRIVVIGDTGCRITETVVQDCRGGSTWPFAQVASSAAAEHPDLVIHVGDYHYRESPCPTGRTECAGSPWGYGWDAWKADLFEPARALFAAAPWVVVRGNHEECARAGQGWFRFLDVRPYQAARSCDRATLDDNANFSEPYAVPLGDGSQLAVFDSSFASNAPPDESDPGDRHKLAMYEEQGRTVAHLTQGMQESFFTSHHPLLAFAPATRTTVYAGNPSLQAAFRRVNGDAYFPAGIEATLHGHVHLFQAITFSSGHPPTLVAGNGGDELDHAFPDPFPIDRHPAPGATVAHFDYSGSFGYLVMDKTASGWTIHAKRADGTLLRDCTLHARTLACGPAQASH